MQIYRALCRLETALSVKFDYRIVFLHRFLGRLFYAAVKFSALKF